MSPLSSLLQVTLAYPSQSRFKRAASNSGGSPPRSPSYSGLTNPRRGREWDGKGKENTVYIGIGTLILIILIVLLLT